jgi:hypothetical protein
VRLLWSGGGYVQLPFWQQPPGRRAGSWC